MRLHCVEPAQGPVSTIDMTLNEARTSFGSQTLCVLGRSARAGEVDLRTGALRAARNEYVDNMD